MKKLLKIECIALLIMASTNVWAVTPDFPKVTTAEIVAKTLACTDCADWKLEGVCFWLDCGWTGCSIKESLKVSHYIPDLVVSTYTSDTAWVETRPLTDAPAAAFSQRNNKSFDNTPVNYKHAEVWTNPTLSIWNTLMASFDFFCQSPLPVVPTPLLLSDKDPAWNNPVIERLYPQALIGQPKIHTNLTVDYAPLLNGYWAPEYPRCGWGAHPYDAINAAVAAHRATHIVTRKLQPHVYVTTNTKKKCGKGDKCWAPEPVTANDPKDNRFQMLYPEHEGSAKAFGGSPTWANGKTDVYQTYLWTLWRHYECCKDRGSFIDDIDF